MKKFHIYNFLTFFCVTVMMAQVQLTCPPCLPVSGCDKCWASVAEAEANNCSVSAARNASDRINDEKEVNNAPLLEAIIYPNPSYDGFFTIENGDELTGLISIIDPSGKLIDQYQLTQQRRFRFERPLLPGLYYMTFEGDEGGLSSRLLLVNP